MQRLTKRLADGLGARLRTSATVTHIERAGAGWRITSDDGSFAADGVVLATPAGVAAQLVAGFDAELAAQLGRIPSAAMRVIGIAFRATDLPAPLDGFGFLAARGSDVRILGATYTSSIMPDQAPADTVYLRVFMGGATDLGAPTLDADAARAIVLADLRTVLGIAAEPVAFHEVVWPQAIPQYALAHREIVAGIETRAATHAPCVYRQ
jgi:oxygen-dependent protoporphyrinogen oxidase